MPNANAPSLDGGPESIRLAESAEGENWRRWGPYVSERQWGTVREDYSATGSAWRYFTHDMARSRAYRWGEDGIGGLCDDRQRLCLGLALWNGRDPILKERLFGVSGPEGNHGEDVKEVYYYLDATPTYSYLKMLYKYPQREYPYSWLVSENARRGRRDEEFELMDTGIFDGDAYFDVFIEYAKAGPDDILLRVTARNRGATAAMLHLIPQIWFRNTWSWSAGPRRPTLRSAPGEIEIQRAGLDAMSLWYEGEPEPLFCDNDTNVNRLSGLDVRSGYWKDGIHEYVVNRRRDAVNPSGVGTKAGLRYVLSIPPGGREVVRLRLASSRLAHPLAGFDDTFARRIAEADQYYDWLQQGITDADSRRVHRQALAGLLWSQQFYYYDVPRWLEGDPAQPAPPAERRHGRNSEWIHVNNADILSVPDKWEFPWYAAWDLGFHCLPLALVDAERAKEQLVLLTREWYMQPNGQLPAYEWALGDVNPPLHAWAAWRVFQVDRDRRGDEGDLAFLERVFHKLLINFTWWVNRKDTEGRNIFQGGFLGLDNIGVLDRSAPLCGGGQLNQADATSWMAMYCLDLMRIALELSLHNPIYQDVATKFFEHFLYIAAAMTNIGGAGINLWDEQDEFFYDVVSLPNGRSVPLKIRSLVGLTPLFAVEILEPELMARVPDFSERLEWFLKYRPDLAGLVSRWWEPGVGERRLLSLLRGHRMKRLLKRMLDPAEFLSPYGVRSLSRYHRDHPFTFQCDGDGYRVAYEPGESEGELFGGNSNWRGPVWMPINYLIVESLFKFHHYYGDDFKVECPTGSGVFLTIRGIAEELSRRLIALFTRGADGRRAVLGACKKLQDDPQFRDYIPFYEYFHGEDGRGLGASHQTGWTSLVAFLLQPGSLSSLTACARPPAESPAGQRA